MICESRVGSIAMKLSAALIAVGVFAGSFGAVHAQTANNAVPAAVSAAIAEATAVCRTNPADCATAMAAVVAALQQAGLPTTVRDTVLVSVASTLTSLGASLPPDLQRQIAAAVEDLADEISIDNPIREVVQNVIEALDSGLGETVIADLASDN
jgi:uncharacterized membrane protein